MELENCPFCGKKAEIKSRKPLYDEKLFQCGCSDITCRGYIGHSPDYYKRDYELMVKRWNRRPEGLGFAKGAVVPKDSDAILVKLAEPSLMDKLESGPWPQFVQDLKNHSGIQKTVNELFKPINVLNKYVEVCDECLQASCYHGKFMCPEASGAGTILKTISELKELDIEHEDNWSDETLIEIYGDSAPNGYKPSEETK